MRAIATASNALAPVNGYEDHGHLPPDVAFGALRRIADAVKLPVTADLEDGYGLSPEEFVDRLADAGACGANLEDTDHRVGALVDADRQAERIASIKAAARARGFDAVINARVDVHIHKGPVEEGLKRARKYFDAGADCVYPIFLSDVIGHTGVRRPRPDEYPVWSGKASRLVSSPGLVWRGSASVRFCSGSC